MAHSVGRSVKPWYRRRWVIGLLFTAGLSAYLATRTPGNQGPWREDQEKPVHVELSGRTFTVHNIRDFRDDGQGTTQRNYLSKTWRLDQLERVWFGLSHFGPFGLAHSFLSIEFKNGEYLGISIEGRLRPGQIYGPLKGLFRQYTKIYIAATEQDVIGVRSHRRGETVLLYPVSATQEEAERFLLALVADANAAYEAPEFYNTVLDNCLTNLLKNGGRMSEVSAADFRVLLPGHTDRLTYALGITPDDISFEEARRRALINPTLGGIGDTDFSTKIRCGWNNYGDFKLPACP